MIGNAIPPGLILILGAVPAVLLRGRLRSAWMLLLPALSLLNMLALPEGNHFLLPFFRQELVLARVDRLSMVFGIIFHIMAFIANLYAWKVDDRFQNAAGLVYAGAAIGAVFAGDLFTLFIFWEMMTLSATFLIMARRTEKSMAAGFRYFMVHVVSGLCLLGGILLQVQSTGTVAFNMIGLGNLSSWLIFIGFGVNSAWPLLHFWLPDAYPEATVTGAVFLSAFTTKTAVYVLARAYPGTEALIWIGAAMTVFPIFFAVIENNLRRVLSYSLINQVGFMMVGIGIGTELSLNGTVSHAFSHILYKALLFMSMGAVLHQTGKINATDVGGLYRSMPWTCTFCIVGAASISAFPLFSGFVSKSMVMEAAALGDMRVVWFMMLFASAGVLHHAGIKIPFSAFFSHDSGIRCKEAPLPMLLAMGLAAYAQTTGLWMLLFILGYIACFALSVGPVTWVILSEVFPTCIRGRAMAIATICLWIANYIVSQTFPMMDANPWLVNTFHRGLPFWLYGAFCAVLLVFTWAFVPETKGKTLEEIERHWGR